MTIERGGQVMHCLCWVLSLQSLQRPRGSSGGRRKSSSQLSASLMLGQRGGVVDIYDSGIASQEDLSAAMLHTLQQYSVSAGSSPSHPPVGASAICLPGRLTNEQCRLAEVAAQALVSREFAAAAAAAAIVNKPPPQQTQQNQNMSQQQYNNSSSTSSSMYVLTSFKFSHIYTSFSPFFIGLTFVYMKLILNMGSCRIEYM